MKKLIATFIISSFCLSPIALAHPGSLDSNGGHYCRTNCAKWGLKTGQYHCHKVGCKVKK